MDCVFCSIVAGSAPSQRVYADETAIAFLDIRPVRRGHVLVIPREHADGVRELDPETAQHVYRVARHLAVAARAALGAEGVNFFINDGKAAFQTVFHHHLHVVPRHRGDRLGFLRGIAHLGRDHNAAGTAALLRSEVERLGPLAP